jgi:hypothetical protein
VQGEDLDGRARFRCASANPEAFDLVVNTHVLGVEGAVEAIKGALSRVTRQEDGLNG